MKTNTSDARAFIKSDEVWNRDSRFSNNNRGRNPLIRFINKDRFNFHITDLDEMMLINVLFLYRS